jgi:hypothetical protein
MQQMKALIQSYGYSQFIYDPLHNVYIANGHKLQLMIKGGRASTYRIDESESVLVAKPTHKRCIKIPIILQLYNDDGSLLTAGKTPPINYGVYTQDGVKVSCCQQHNNVGGEFVSLDPIVIDIDPLNGQLLATLEFFCYNHCHRTPHIFLIMTMGEEQDHIIIIKLRCCAAPNIVKFDSRRSLERICDFVTATSITPPALSASSSSSADEYVLEVISSDRNEVETIYGLIGNLPLTTIRIVKSPTLPLLSLSLSLTTSPTPILQNHFKIINC